MGVLLSLSGLLGSGMSKSEQTSIIKSTILLKFLENFMVLNMPCITKLAFSIRYQILKILGKRN